MSHGVHPVLQKASLNGILVVQVNQQYFQHAYGHIFDHSPWVVERAWSKGPFEDAKALHRAFLEVIASASEPERIGLAKAHPELADKVAIAHGLTADSAEEQASAGLDRLSADEFAAFHAANQAYRERHDFPFIICVKLHDRASILAAMQTRALNDTKAELDEAMTQVGLISWLRLAEIRPARVSSTQAGGHT